MPVISRVCSSAASAKNPCKRIQKTTKPITGYWLATNDQAFDSENLISLETVKAAIATKKLQVGYQQSSLEESIDDGIAQTATRDSKDNLSQHRITINHKANAKQASVISSWENVYSRVYFFTADGYLICEVGDDGKVRGLPLYTLLTSVPPITGGENFTKLFLQMKELQSSELKPNIDFDVIDGIYDLTYEVIGTPTATEFKFKATSCCSAFDLLETADVTFTTEEGVAQSVTIANANGVYTASGTGLTTGTLSTAGVITKGNVQVEGSTTITIS